MVSPNQIRAFGEVLGQCSDLGRSSFTTLANVKAKLVSKQLFPAERLEEYNEVFKMLKSTAVPPRQEKPILPSAWKEIDSSWGQLTIAKQLLVRCWVTVWFVMMWPEEVPKMVAKTTGARRSFTLASSKVDQQEKGFSITLTCCCKQTLVKNFHLCPVHCCTDGEFEAFSKFSYTKFQNSFLELLHASGIQTKKKLQAGERREYNLYSLRIGGAQSALLANTSRAIVQQVGRWKQEETMCHYEASVSLSHDETDVLEWPLVKAVVQ